VAIKMGILEFIWAGIWAKFSPTQQKAQVDNLEEIYLSNCYVVR